MKKKLLLFIISLFLYYSNAMSEIIYEIIPGTTNIRVTGYTWTGIGGDVQGYATIPPTACDAKTGACYTVTEIGNGAFYFALFMKGISIPNPGAFSRCSKLSKVTFGSGLRFIDHNVFSGDSLLSEIAIPNSVKTIGSSAFVNCASLSKVSLGNSVETIGSGAFEGCNLAEIIIPASVTTLGGRSFSKNTGLKKVIFEDGTDDASSFSSDAFEDSPVETLYLGRNGSNNLFNRKNSLKEVAIGNTVTTVGHSAFENCTGITSIVIPDGMTTIGYTVFSGCTSLESVGIPQSVTTIADAFLNCTAMKTVTFEDGKSPVTIAASAFQNAPIETLYLGRNSDK